MEERLKYESRSISRVLSWTIIHLRCLSPDTLSDLPENHVDHMRLKNNPFSYLVLLRAGFTMPFMLPSTRCALTAPFHPYPYKYRRFIFCCTFHGLTPSRRYLAPCPMEPGLSSIDLNNSDCLDQLSK